uniref:Uncharacterized protein n=1 Tax=Plectus sambesii TaxID=2011161 RepID=A0A914W196_9BILA
MALIGLLSAAAFVIVVALTWLIKLQRLKKRVNKIQGVRGLFAIGNVHVFRFNPDEFFEQAQGVAYMFQRDGVRMTRIWLAHMPMILMYGAEECEVILGSNKTLSKTFQYSMLSPWIGTGLLISEPEKWRPRRKLLTPTFHYDILKDFVCVYNKHAKTLVGKFDSYVGGGFRNIFHDITLCTLDIICEAALGRCIDAQKKESPYLTAVFNIKYIIHQRQIKPYLYPEFIFRWFGRGKEQEEHVKVLHDMTSKAIHERKRMVDEAGGVQKLLEKETASGKRRMAFLDLMLDMNAKGELPLEGIQEEVDTFTFEGHDTTSTSMNWFLHLVAANPLVQEKLHLEMDEVFGDCDRDFSYDDLAHLTYLECCIKETLRLYPSVPLFAREIREDIDIKGVTLPAGTNVVIVPSMVHRDPKHWEDPEVFRPERFLSQEVTKRHPYAYIPFSAGSRNCIGQRFAIMEEKCVLSTIMRKFKIKSKLRTDQMRVSAELIIRPMFGNHLSFERRKFGEY